MESKPTQEPVTKQAPAPVRIVREPLKVLYTWKAPARPFKHRSREVFTTLFSIIFLICVILLFIKEWLLIMVLISIAFLFYVQNTVKPDEVEHKITNKGITTGNTAYPWELLGRFWFDKQFDDTVLLLEHFGGFPSRIMMVTQESKKKELKKLLSEYLLQEKPEKTQIEKAGEWLHKKIPLETLPNSSSPASKK